MNHTNYEELAQLEAALQVVRLGVEMRECQNRYFANRSKENLIASKVAESKFDKAAKAVFEVTN
ncbi:MAG: hypothetical protein JWP57_4651 [Spirosoma sp.]|nr:hypothetical protein [Spirosoma sp.]